MKRSAKRFVVIAIIIVASIILGLTVNLMWDIFDKVVHPYEYYEYVSKYSKEYGIPEELIYAVIKVESNFDPNATSSVGAMGLMQMMPKTFEWLTGAEHLGENLPTEALYDPDTSIRYGTYYLRYLYKKFNNVDTTLAAYNGGEGNVAKWLKDPLYSDDGVSLKDIPFEETKNYVSKVNKEIDTYKNLYGEVTEND